DLLKKIEAGKPDGLSLTTYIREAVERDLNRKQIEESGRRYADFLSNHPQESAWLKDWESARLDLEIKPKARPRKKD
ncbi:MAG: hypothetical protein JWQ35_913, partial [Bacteriovoracaceae bacterium]|nr:hypothetical protein [Bacteriovoracaceae bacterium]